MFPKKDHIGPKTLILITSLTHLACQGGVVFVFWLVRSSQGVFVFVIVFVILSLSFDLSSSLHSPWVLLSGWQLHSALLSPPLNLSSCLSHHCTFPPLSIQGAARGRVTGSTNERAAQVGTNQSEGEKLGCSCRTGSAAPLRGEGASSPVAASSPWSRRAPWGPTLSLHTSPSAKGRLSAIHRSYTAPPPPQCILARSFKGPFCPSKGFPIELCIFQLLFAAQHCTAMSTTAELFRINAELFRNRQEVQEGFYHYRITWISAPPSYSHQTPGLSLTAL